MDVLHAAQCANWHISSQGETSIEDVPNDTLRYVPNGTLNAVMENAFKSALQWHMQEHGTRIVDLVQRTGVSRDVINKILTRENATTSVDNALLIAAFYGKTVEQFINCENVDPSTKFANLLNLLDADEFEYLAAQVQFMLRARKPK